MDKLELEKTVLEDQSEQIQDSVTEFDSASQTSSKTPSVTSVKLRKAELLARARALKKKQALQLEKLRLEQQQDALELQTELEVSEAQVKVLQEYESNSSGPVKTPSSTSEVTFKEKHVTSVDLPTEQGLDSHTSHETRSQAQPTPGVSSSFPAKGQVSGSATRQQDSQGNAYTLDGTTYTGEADESRVHIVGHKEHFGLMHADINRDTVHQCEVAGSQGQVRSELNVHAPRFRPSQLNWHESGDVSRKQNVLNDDDESVVTRISSVRSYPNQRCSVTNHMHDVVDYDKYVTDTNIAAGNVGSEALKVNQGSLYSTPMGDSVRQSGDVISSLLKQMRKPVTDIKRFSGDPLEYHQFIRQFQTKIVVNSESPDELMTYLEQYTTGEANKIVQGFSFLNADVGYPAAMNELKERYGNKEVVAHAFVKRALEWPVISADKPKALDRYAIFLCECDNAVKSIDAVRVLEYPDNLRKLIGKLPMFLHDKWRGLIDRRRESGEAITFSLLANFVKQEAKKANDPVYGRETLYWEHKQNTTGKTLSHRQPVITKAKGTSNFATLSNNSSSGVSELDQKQSGRESMQRKSRNGNEKPCLYCRHAAHALVDCVKIDNLAHEEKIDFFRTKGLCFGCLRSGHPKRFCRNKATCVKCKGNHPTILHIDSKKEENLESMTSQPLGPESAGATAVTSSCGNVGSSDMGAGDADAAMAIIPVKVRMKNSTKFVETYAFLDPGSNVSFCTEDLMYKLGINGREMKITIDTMGMPHTMTTFSVQGMEIWDLQLENQIELPNVYSKKRMPVSKAHIPTDEDISKWAHLQNISLPQNDSDIGLLIGGNVPDAYAPLEVITGPRGSPHAARTRLGWIVWNVLRERDQRPVPATVNRADVMAVEYIEDLKKLDCLVRQSFNLDFPERAIEDSKEPSQQDKKFLEKTNQSMKLKQDGHYEISLPFKGSEPPVMPNNERQALQRLKYLERKMAKNEKFKQDYLDFMATLKEKGFAEEVSAQDIAKDGDAWYIPHHGVYHPKKPDKIRVVFDCAATYEGVSLNNQLLSGPDLTNSLIGVLIRFREEKIAIMGDIEAMFYQVAVPESDRNYLRFYWWKNNDLTSKPVPHQMTVHLFGAVSSPSISNVALHQTAKDNKHLFESEVVDAIYRNFYVDDYLKSVDSEERAEALIRNVSSLCQMGGFRLTKWVSNSRRVISSVPEQDRAKDVKSLDLTQDSLPCERALGVYWSVESDEFGFRIQLRNQPLTRRGVLSVVSSVYDPLGFAAPFVLQAKIILQDLCRSGIGWDEEITGPNLQKWQQWLADLPGLESFTVRRCYKPDDFGNVVSCEVHNFSDASNAGYGVVSYVRLQNENGRVHCSFVMGKSRVSPLKRITIPRMELTAAMVAVRLNQMIVKELEYKVTDTYFWTDSTSVIKYIKNETSRYQTFVANRISVIREVSDVQNWKYVNTKHNPADDASRGLTMAKFLENQRWLTGPSFLWDSSSEWPDQDMLAPVQAEIPDVKGRVNASLVEAMTVVNSNQTVDRLLAYYSDFTKLKKAVCWLQLAFQNIKKWVRKRKEIRQHLQNQGIDNQTCQVQEDLEMKTFKQNEMSLAKEKVKSISLSNEMLENAEMTLIRCVQNREFADEIRCLQSDSPQNIKRSSPIYKMDPMLKDGILRVGGRLERSTLPFVTKHQILLPKDSPIATLILQDIHANVGHLGKNAMLTTLRQRYWIVGAANKIKSLIARCVICRKVRARGGQQKMADLPSERLVTGEPPFSRVGMDYFGPFDVKRGRSTVKRYGVIFTCLAIRAVHLEVASSLDTDSCLNAIRRFIARRGQVKFIKSDNGTNLVGARNELLNALNQLNHNRIINKLQQKGIQWEFNPPAASHFGGVWERMIRTVRKVLQSLLHQQNIRLDDESLQTLFCEVEAIVNGRPITDVPSSSNDLDALTPNHLLHQSPGESLPPGVFDKQDNYVRRRWRQVQYLADVFWKRWSKEYLTSLQQRQKWQKPTRNILVNDIVLIIDNTCRNTWSLGRVIETVKDKKGFVRSAKVKTKVATLERPISKLCLILEADD